MTRSTLLTATAIVLSAALATPSMAKDMKAEHAKKEMRMSPQRMHSRQISSRDNMARRNGDMAYRNDRNGWNNNGDWAWNDNRRDSGFWPADAAAGVVGGAVAATDAAVDTAGAIATAPFRNDGYAYNNGYNNNYAYNSADSDNWGWNDNRHDSGFWPADAAAGVVDGAVNTAGAIATAPFHSNSYAYYNNNNGWNNGYDNGWNGQSYAQRNGFVCQPGTWFKGDDGRRHICQ
jgi:hypothetical protein